MNLSSKKLFHNFKNMNCVIPAQIGLSNRKLASKVTCQLQVYGIRFYLEMYKTYLYLDSIKNGCTPIVPNSSCTLESPGRYFSQTLMPRVSLPEILISLISGRGWGRHSYFVKVPQMLFMNSQCREPLTICISNNYTNSYSNEINFIIMP